MAIQITTMEVISGQSLNYGSSGTYTGLVRFGLTDSLSVSSVTAVRIDQMTMGNAISSSPTPYTFTISGAALPRTLVVDGFTTEYIGYTVVVNNNYLHANTDNLYLSSYMAAYSEISGGTTQGTETSSYVGAFMTSNPGTIIALGDAGAPNPPTNFTAVGGDKVVALTWTNTTGGDWSNTVIEQSIVAPVTSVGMGTVVYTATAAAMSAVSVPVNVLGTEVYYFGAYSTDNVGKTSTLVTATPDASAVPTWGVWPSLAEHSRLYVQGTF